MAGRGCGMTVCSTAHLSEHPLQGRRIVVTQAALQAPELADLLRASGAAPLLYPCIDIRPPDDPATLDQALALATQSGFDWLVLTSTNAVCVVAQRLATLGLTPQHLAGMRVATVGASTAAAVQEQLGLAVTLTPEAAVAEALADLLVRELHPGDRVLLPQAALARPVLANRLAAAGVVVTQVVAYDTVRGSGGADLPNLLAQRAVDAVTLASSSAFRFLLERLTLEGSDPALLHGLCLACIGPVTARTVEEAGFCATVVAAEQSLVGMIAVLARHFQTRPEGVP